MTTLTPAQKRWLDGLRRHIARMPDGIELLVGAGCIDAHPAGWYLEHIYSTDIDMLRAGEFIFDASLYHIRTDRTRVRPNSEGE